MRRPLLIDTNGVSNFYLYHLACITVDKQLGASIDELKAAYDSLSVKPYIDFTSIEKGWKLYIRLNRDKDEIVFYFSTLSEIELMNVFLDRVFDQDMIKKNIPYRLRTKKYLRMQISFNYEDEVRTPWENFIEDLRMNCAIEFETPEVSKGETEQILDVSKIIRKYINLGTIDLYLYSASIYLRADLFTHDQELKNTINDIRGLQEWQTIKKSIIDDLVKYIPTFKEEFELESKIILPTGISN